MAFFQGTIYSEALGGMTPLTVILPQALADTPWRGDTAPRPVLYLLHGHSDDHTIWVRRTNLERYAIQYGLTVIMPDGGRSFYTDMKHGGKYFQYIAEELPLVASRLFHFSRKPEDTFIAGNSMGGYGALKLFLTYPERFGSCGGFSAAIEPILLPEKFPPMKQEIEDVFGTLENYKREGNDLYRLAQKCILEGRSLAPLFPVTVPVTPESRSQMVCSALRKNISWHWSISNSIMKLRWRPLLSSAVRQGNVCLRRSESVSLTDICMNFHGCFQKAVTAIWNMKNFLICPKWIWCGRRFPTVRCSAEWAVPRSSCCRCRL